MNLVLLFKGILQKTNRTIKKNNKTNIYLYSAFYNLFESSFTENHVVHVKYLHVLLSHLIDWNWVMMSFIFCIDNSNQRVQICCSIYRPKKETFQKGKNKYVPKHLL